VIRGASSPDLQPATTREGFSKLDLTGQILKK
jgi:hypothetical protein